MSSNSFFPAISSIKTINNIKFTSRQVDVMACKMNNLTTSKEVANALFIEVGTVEKHTENIHKAASVNSAAALREFLRAQPELDELYQYFSHSLLPQQAFFQTIETLKNACEKRKIDSFESGLCFVCACSTEKKQRPASVDRLKKALEINRNKNQNSAEIDVIKLEECYEKETLLRYKKVVFFVDERNLKSSTFQKLLETLPSQEVILFFKGDAQLLSVISPPYNERVIETTTFDSFSYEVLKSFLSYLIEDPEIRDILNNKMHDVLKVAEGAPLFPKSSPYFAADQATKEGLENPSKRLRKAPAAIMSSALVVLLFVGGWAYSSFSKFAGDLVRSVQCELKLPQENVLIKRSSLLQKLTNMFMKHPAASGNVTVMGITGVAGSGKTTLARLWGRQWKRSHKNGVVWELAAESQTALTESIRLLGFSLAHSKEQKQEVHFIDDMKSVRDKDKMFVQFIRSQLQGREWMLIIDNATSPEKIQDLVFQEGGENGKGVVLLTSRNHLFKNCSFVPQQNILTLPSLSENNSLSLLCRILYDCTLDQLTEAQKLEARQFLKKLPPYPLDISVAASFMKENQLSFKEYLYELKAHRQALFTAQDNLMKIVSPSKKPL